MTINVGKLVLGYIDADFFQIALCSMFEIYRRLLSRLPNADAFFASSGASKAFTAFRPSRYLVSHKAKLPTSTSGSRGNPTGKFCPIV